MPPRRLVVAVGVAALLAACGPARSPADATAPAATSTTTTAASATTSAPPAAAPATTTSSATTSTSTPSATTTSTSSPSATTTSTTAPSTTTSAAPTTSGPPAATTATTSPGEPTWLGADGSLELPGDPVFTFAVATEAATGVDPGEVAAFVDETLSDPRSWTAAGVGFRRVPWAERGAGAIALVVATPATVDRLCAPLRTNGIYSCGRNGWIALNLERWLGATSDWPADLTTYRRYLVQHEIGHYLGRSHQACPGPGLPAPVMMQQTKGLDGCLPNPWPVP